MIKSNNPHLAGGEPQFLLSLNLCWLQGGGTPLVISWFIIPIDYIDITPINPNYWTYKLINQVLVAGFKHFLLSISYMGCHPIDSYFSRWLLHHQPVVTHHFGW